MYRHVSILARRRLDHERAAIDKHVTVPIMEIDFLGLSSKHSTRQKEQQNSNDSFTDSGDEISLSLCTSFSLDCQKDILDFSENTWKFHGEKTRPQCSSSSSNNTFSALISHSLEHLSSKEPTFVASPRYANVTNETLSDQAEMTTSIAGISSPRPPYDPFQSMKRGYAPTVSMARKATLVRFLKKRSHRLTQARKSFFICEFLNDTNTEASNTKMKHGG